jgi:hypothetical protein
MSAGPRPFVKPAPRSLRGKSGSRADSRGIPGRRWRWSTPPNKRKRHEPGPSTGCGADLAGAPRGGPGARRQVFDLPPMAVRVTEHQLIVRPTATPEQALDCALGFYLAEIKPPKE